MKVKGIFDFIGLSEFKGKKDVTKMFYNAVLLQGVDTVKVFLDSDSVKLFTGLKKMDSVDCELDIKIGADKTYLNVVSVRKVA